MGIVWKLNLCRSSYVLQLVEHVFSFPYKISFIVCIKFIIWICVYIFSSCPLTSVQSSIWKKRNVPLRQKTYHGTCAHSEDSDQTAHCAVWSESSLGTFWIAKNVKFLHAGNEDPDQTARMRRLIWVFLVRRWQNVCFLSFRLKWGSQREKMFTCDVPTVRILISQWNQITCSGCLPCINTIIPEFLKWTLPPLNLDMPTAYTRGLSVYKTRMTNSADPDETSRLIWIYTACTGIWFGW